MKTNKTAVCSKQYYKKWLQTTKTRKKIFDKNIFVSDVSVKQIFDPFS